MQYHGCWDDSDRAREFRREMRDRMRSARDEFRSAFKGAREAAGSRRGGFFGDAENFFGGFWGGRGGQGGPFGGRRGRVFEQGDLKYVVLRLLDEKPRHGYEIIKEIEERFGGAYSPSPGTVYPTLAMLEDLGFARATPEEGGRKIYEITDEGRAHLAEHRSTVDDIFERIAQFGNSVFSETSMNVNRAIGEVARAVYSSYGKRDDAQLAKVAEILKKAAAEIDELKKANT